MHFHDLRIARKITRKCIFKRAVAIWLKHEYFICTARNKFISAHLRQLSYYRIINISAVSRLIINSNVTRGSQARLIQAQGRHYLSCHHDERNIGRCGLVKGVQVRDINAGTRSPFADLDEFLLFELQEVQLEIVPLSFVELDMPG